MFSKSTLLHLRIPFSYFLLPIFLFALAISPNLAITPSVLLPRVLWIFALLHIFLYPASNGYNSYFDKDVKSIGGLKNPPPVSRGLYWTSLLFDAIVVVFGTIQVSIQFAAMALIYGLVSKAYSHPSIRLKRYPVSGWLVTGFFQGFFTFLMCYLGLNHFDLSSAFEVQALAPASLASLMLWANYPMTQVYQHEEDAARGDRTLSILLGIRGTFYFSALFFGLTAIGFCVYFIQFYQVRQALGFLVALSPVIIYFSLWFLKVFRDPTQANFTRMMRLNGISATCLIIFFVWLILDARNIG